MSPYTILKKVEPPEKCYLLEVLYWRAFGRFPEMVYDNDGKDWRFSKETLQGFAAPESESQELTDEECSYAGLPQDPRMAALIEVGGYSDLDFYDRMLATGDGDDIDPQALARLATEREGAVLYYEALENWLVGFNGYLDQFQLELCLKLRRGDLSARGTKLPDRDREKTGEILEKSDRWLTDLEVIEIPKETWIYESISWEESAVYGNSEAYIWIHFNVQDMLKSFPPELLFKETEITVIGSSFAVTSTGVFSERLRNVPRGRPALPWAEFHVEVARMFKDQTMPRKKEAAIAQLQDWFKVTLNRDVSRAAIGEKLKPYFDALVWK